MQQTGTVRKRKRRNISKVNGLTTLAYDENADIFDGMALFNGPSPPVPNSFAERNFGNLGTIESTFVKMNSPDLREFRRGSYNHHQFNDRIRVTRNPEFHVIALPQQNVPQDPRRQSIWNWSRKTSEPLLTENRTHFFDKTTMSRLQHLIWLGVICGAFPWTWNKTTCEIQAWSSSKEKIWKFFYSITFIQTSILFLFQIYSLVSTFKSTTTHETYRETFMSSMALLWYIYNLSFSVNMILFRDRTRQYINTLLIFNKAYVDKYVISLDGYQNVKNTTNKVIMNVTIPTNIIQPFVCAIFFYFMPFQPWYLFSYIYPKPWYYLLPGIWQEFSMVSHAASAYLLLSWLSISHCNAISFWLMETHNYNDSDYTTDELRQPKTSLETYKSLQILSQMFNECMAPAAILCIKMTVLTGAVSCGFIIIRSMNSRFWQELPAILTYPVAFIDASTVGFAILTMAAQMQDLASSYLDSWSRTKHKGLRRILMSLPSLRMRVGRFYFITVATTITFFKVIFDLITDTIITFP